MPQPAVQQIYLVSCVGTTIRFDDRRFEVDHCDDGIRVSVDADNYVTVSRQSLEVPYESTVSSDLIVSEKKRGEIDYSDYFLIDWEEEVALPELHLKRPPAAIVRLYSKGQSIELGLEDVTEYRVVYKDGVEAKFKRRRTGGFDFSFSTGFYGSFWKDPDDSYTLKFKGDRLKPSEDAYHSQSKFIVSRCKYSGNMLLILQDDAQVFLS